MLEVLSCVSKGCLNVLDLQIRKLLDNLLGCEPRRKQFEDMHDPDAQSSNTWSTPALLFSNRDAIE